ncbi:hypothetical protein B0T10DRAFT_484684 [Thelonectria olida]|uniref:Agouti signaling protein n=1 Tax=Thelonectria olida TaxID=1576542 RepID=A0A9P9ARG8_9HYPO|nr:hypothetical protein B0T10DRAFT_484684 [Thelonectria olida]
MDVVFLFHLFAVPLASTNQAGNKARLSGPHPRFFFFLCFFGVFLFSDFFPEKPSLPHLHHSASQASPPLPSPTIDVKPKRKARPRRHFQLRVPNIIVLHCTAAALRCTAPPLCCIDCSSRPQGTCQKRKKRKKVSIPMSNGPHG